MKKIVILALILYASSSGIFSNTLNNDGISTISPDSSIFNVEESINNYLDLLTPEQKEKSDTYFEGGYWLLLVGFLVEIIVAWIFLSLGLSKWIKRTASRFKNINIQNLSYALFYFLFAYIISFPLNIYSNFFREHKFGLSNMNFGAWLSEDLTGFLMTFIIMIQIVTFLFILFRVC